jgi:hypothetical protein
MLPVTTRCLPQISAIVLPWAVQLLFFLSKVAKGGLWLLRLLLLSVAAGDSSDLDSCDGSFRYTPAKQASVQARWRHLPLHPHCSDVPSGVRPVGRRRRGEAARLGRRTSRGRRSDSKGQAADVSQCTRVIDRVRFPLHAFLLPSRCVLAPRPVALLSASVRSAHCAWDARCANGQRPPYGQRDMDTCG